MFDGIIKADGVLSINIIIEPSINWAAATSGLSVYLTLGKGFIFDFELITSIKLCSPKVRDFIFKSSISFSIFFKESFFTFVSKYPKLNLFLILSL